MRARTKRLPRLWCALQGLLPLEACLVAQRAELAWPIALAEEEPERNRPQMDMVEIKVEIPSAAADAADTLLLEREAEPWSVLQDVIVGRAWLVGIFPDAREAQAAWRELGAALAAAEVAPLGEAVVRSLGDADWRDSYKAHFHAWKFGRLHWVPVWERDAFTLPRGDAVLWLDPGLAFGTGNHETTRLCVERLSGRAEGGSRIADLRVVDAGCGSGILALSAVLLGFREVAGFDNDPEAVRVSEENAALNGLTGRVRFAVGDLISGLAGRDGAVDVLLANIQADVLMRFSGELVRAVAPGGTLILSGVLAVENAQVRSTFAALTPGWASDARVMGEWSDVVLMRPV